MGVHWVELLFEEGGLPKWVNRGTWHVVVDRGCGTNDRLHGGDPLQMADHLDDVDWRGIWEWVKTGWWTQWVKTVAGVAGAVPGGLFGGVGG